MPRLLSRGVLLSICLVAALTTTAYGQVAISSGATPYEQSFDSLASTGTSDVLPAGWAFSESGSNANLTYAAGTGSSTAGNTYSFGTDGSSDRAFGTLLSGSVTPTIGAEFVNATSSVISALEITYTGELWRLGVTNRADSDRLDFQYSTDASSLGSGAWVDVNTLDFITPASGSSGARDGNLPENRTTVSGIITGLTVPPGGTIWIRWSDFNISSSDDGLAVDDFRIVAQTTTVSDSFLTIGDAQIVEGNSGTSTATLEIQLTPAPTSSVTFDVATAGVSATAGVDYFEVSHAGHIAAGATTFTFDVTIVGDTDFENDETFVVTVSNISGATAADAEAVVTILNDEVAPAAPVTISQVYGGGGNSGATLRNDFIELFNRSATAVSLDGWSVQYASSSGSSWQVTPLSGTLEPGRYYLVQQAAGSTGTVELPMPNAIGSIPMAASSGKVALVSSTTALSEGCPIDVVDFVGYGSANCFEGVSAADGLSNTTAAHRASGGCVDTNANGADFSRRTPTPRNGSFPRRDCENPGVPLEINTIQGNGAESPFLGVDARTSGIVTATKSNGFFLQSPDHAADSDDSTSEGIFVFTSGAPGVAAGDAVTVTGFVSEFFGLTQMSANGAAIVINGNRQPLPTPVALGTTDPLEWLEGMRVSAASLTSVAGTNDFGEIWTVPTGTPRPFREPGLEASVMVPPGAPCCIPEFDGNPERVMIDTDGQFGASPIIVTTGVTLTGVTGPLDFTFDDYKVIPDVAPTVTPNRTVQPLAAPLPGQFTIASANLLNFDGSAGRVAKNALAFRTILASPDIIGVQEVLTLQALEALAAKINADTVAAGGSDPGYVARLFPGNIDGGIDVGVLVKTSRVDIISVEQFGKDEIFAYDGKLLNDRPPLVVRAGIKRPDGPAYPVTVVVNHLRSLIDVEIEERVREKRRAQAESLARLVDELQSAGEAVVVLGDMNAFQFNDGYVDVIGTIRGVPTPSAEVLLSSADLVDPDLSNMLDRLPDAEQYSYVFGGNAQVLDHILLNDVAAGRTCSAAYGRLNADYPYAYGADFTRPERISDHDMPVAYFAIPPAISDVSVDKPVIGPANHKMVDVQLSYSVTGGCRTTTTVAVSSNEPSDGTGDGSTAADWEIVGNHHVRLRAERSGRGDGRVYTITVTVTDHDGTAVSRSVTVAVPKNY